MAQVTSPPFDSLALKDRGIHKVLTSDDVLGRPSTFLVLAMSESFARENPKTTKAVLLAVEDAMALIKENRAKAAAAVYLKRDDAKLDQTFIEQLLASTNNRYETGPIRIMKYVEFLLATKVLRHAPSDWHELFLPLIRDKGGS